MVVCQEKPRLERSMGLDIGRGFYRSWCRLVIDRDDSTAEDGPVMEMSDRVALVTGGGRRLGRGISAALAGAGAHVVVHYGRSRGEAEQTGKELEQLGIRVECLQADLMDAQAIERLFREVQDRFGRLDILVNSAASFEKSALGEISAEKWDRVLAVNLRAPLLCMRAALPLLGRGKSSRKAPAAIINVADLSGIHPWPGYAHHGVSKAGLLHLTAIAARELAPSIRVNSVVPGPILPPPGASEQDDDWQQLMQTVPMKRAGTLREIGEAVVFLCQNDFITGERLVVDGGEHLLGAGKRSL